MAAAAVVPVLVAFRADVAGGGWQRGAAMPVPRTEVAAATVAGEIAVAGGFLPDGSSSRRADAYAPRLDRWRRLPDLPLAVNHAMAAGYRGRLYVVGGVGPAGLARRALVFDLERRRWTTVVGPTPREHLAVTAWNGRVYALAGRLSGIDTNLRALQSYGPGARRWLDLPPIPHARGGTGAAAIAGRIVSIGGEEPGGTIASVYAYDIAARRWQRLDDLPSPRHGLGVATAAGRVYAIGGGPRPGLFVSDTNEFLPVP